MEPTSDLLPPTCLPPTCLLPPTSYMYLPTTYLRIQVVQNLVSLLGSSDSDVRQRAGITLREMNTKGEGGGEDTKAQKEAAMAGGVAPLVALLISGLEEGRVEAQEYALPLEPLAPYGRAHVHLHMDAHAHMRMWLCMSMHIHIHNHT